MYHVELRQFPHSTRAFNLSRDQLDARIVMPWVRGQAIELHDRRWLPERAKLTIYEAPELATEDMGMGRGWANVTRSGEEVTGRVLEEMRHAVESPPVLGELKDNLVARAEQGPLAMADVLALAGGLRSDLTPNERIDLAARAIWELLGEGRLTLSIPSRSTD